MRASSRAPVTAPVLVCLLASVAAADTWINGVTPRLVGRGGTSELVITGWRHEATDVLFYPRATFAPWTAADADARGAVGIRCVGTAFDAAKERLVCTLEVAPDCRPGEHPFRVLTAAGLSSMGTASVSPFPVIDEAEAKPDTNDTPDTASASVLAREVNAAGLCRAISTSRPVEVAPNPSTRNELLIFWNMATSFRAWVREAHPDADYVLFVDCVYTPGRWELGFVHLIVCDRSGEWAIADFQNSEHPDYQAIKPTSSEACGRLAVRRLASYLR